MKNRLYKLYHIRIKGNEDLKQGYIGITRRSIYSRLKEHFNSRRPVGKILRSLGEEAVEVVELGRYYREEALEREYNLRPELRVGWNIQAGGNRITVKCPDCGKYLPKRKTGTYCIECKETRFQKGHKPFNYGKGEKYKLIDPQGNIYYPEAFTVFCRENNLTPQNLRKVAKGVRKHHKGWKAVKI